MYLFISLLLGSMVLKSHQLVLSDCGDTYRSPEYNDISVECGTSTISLAILLCPVVFTGYNESLLILNKLSDDPQCKGTMDESVTPPVIRFEFPLNATNSCGSVFKTTSAVGTGVFSDFSNIERVNISGMVRSHDVTTGTVTYNAELKYYFSCSYPLEYLINNTRLDVATSSIAVTDNNGSFISTLKMELYSDINYTTPLIIPLEGIELRTVVFVQVVATNLTAQYNVLLDRCYASTAPNPTDTSIFNLFVSSCSSDQFTTMLMNGDNQNARFSFPAFRFIEQQNQTVSTYYLHCITRLCEISTCSKFKECGERRKRDVNNIADDGVTNSTTLTSANPIVTRAENVVTSKEEALSGGNSSSTTGLGIAVGVLAAVVIMVGGMAFLVYKRAKHL
ncbi:zona pellucida-like domain-containing protein 1 [Gadus morhua]|uniref:Zona pellucida-like domain-containing protein 1 n=1 Tax=Gadus morhua TaxID=8049 RepID=A0A8C5A270_GADMO|nr:zona pellucida-like domain-containing protein 1 [Gadus morhua]